MHLQSYDSGRTGSIDIMNTCHAVKHNDALCQILKIKDMGEAQYNSICLIGTKPSYKKMKTKSQECWPTFNPSTWELESEDL